MTAIIDYGVGNLFSLKSSFEAVGEQTCVTGDPSLIEAADRVVLPGVGAFGDAMDKLNDAGLCGFVKTLAQSGKPFLGICLGMQLLFTDSSEFGMHEGLSLLPGHVRPIGDVIPSGLNVPHMGWNALSFHGRKDDGIFRDLPDGTHVYFVHSYAAFDCDSVLTATAEYGVPLTAAVAKGNIFGVQFHPEKSGEAGLRILRAFVSVNHRT